MELTVHKESVVSCRGNKGSGTEISSCAIYLFIFLIETWNLVKCNSIQVLQNSI